MAADHGNQRDVRVGEISLEKTDTGVAVVSISGEHDLNTAPELRRQLDELIGEAVPVVVDLTPASFVDSSILGAILDARRRAAEKELRLAVQHGDGANAVARVLEVTGLRSELPVHSSRDEAVSDASGSAPKAST